jgi:hypothetical protein
MAAQLAAPQEGLSSVSELYVALLNGIFPFFFLIFEPELVTCFIISV